LIRDSEASEAAIELIHPEVAQYRAGWVHISVTRDRFSASTTDPACQGPLRDLVIGIFGLLEQTPTTRLGLNRSMHIDLLDEKSWHALGHLVAPKEPWAGILEKPGMRTLLMEALRSDGAAGREFFRVEPSQKHAHSVFLEVNSEYHADSKVSPGEVTSDFVGRIRSDWERVMEDAVKSMMKLVQHVVKGT
jgi:hypothetical protein